MRKKFHGQQRSHTKSGPGRFHGEGRLFFIEGQKRAVVRESQQRLRTARFGGNWKGLPYFSFAETDSIFRVMQEQDMTRKEAEAHVISLRAA